MCAECASKTLSRSASLPYMKTVRYIAIKLWHRPYYMVTITRLICGRLYTIIKPVTTSNVVLYTARASYANSRLPRIIGFKPPNNNFPIASMDRLGDHE